MKKFDSFINGKLKVTVCGADICRLINTCAMEEIELGKVRCTDPYTAETVICARDKMAFCAAADRCHCEYELGAVEGLPHIGTRLIKRAFACLSCLAAAAVLVWSVFFVWEIDIQGNETIPDWKIMAALEESGVSIGSYWPAFNSDLIRSSVMEKIPELSWVTVNTYGSRAEVLINERDLPPELFDEKVPTDILASQPGILTDVRVYSGEQLCESGQTVMAGDTLVSGCVSSTFAEDKLTHASADIYARTLREISACTAKNELIKEHGGKNKTMFALILGERRINLYRNSRIFGTNCDKIETVYKLAIEGVFSLPAAIVRIELKPYDLAQKPASENIQTERMYELLDRQLENYLGDDGNIITVSHSISADDSRMTACVRAECIENIAKERRWTETEIEMFVPHSRQEEDSQ